MDESQIQIAPEIDEILTKSKSTPFFGIYENIKPEIDKSKPFLIIIIGPTGSGKSTFVSYLTENGFTRAITATTRKKREEDKQDAYIWLEDKIGEKEDLEKFEKRIANKYKLLETNVFAGNVYGSTKSSIELALHEGKAVMGIENNGAKAVSNAVKDITNIIILFTLPDNLKQLRKRALSTRNDIDTRMEIAKIEIEDSKTFVNYYIHNTELPLYSKNGEYPLDHSRKNLLEFINNSITQ